VAPLIIGSSDSASGDAAGKSILIPRNVVSASMTAVVAAEISFLSFSSNLLYSAVFSMKSAECQYCWQMGVSSLRTRYVGFTSIDPPQLEQDPGL
jgi:hypothetical protein